MASLGAEVLPQLGERLSHPPAGPRGSSSNAHTPLSRKGYSFNEKKRKDLFTDKFCKVCGAVLLMESQRISHYESKKHAQKVQFYFQTHREEESSEPPAKKSKTDHVDVNEIYDKNKYCSLCKMFFSSAVVAQSHYVGKIHAKKLKLAPAEHAIACSPMEQSGPQTKESECGELVAETVPSNPPEPVSEKPNQPDVNIGFPSLSDNVNDFSDPNKDCKLCGAQFNNPLMAKQHYSGKRHTRNEARKRLMVEMGEDVGPSDSSTSVGLGTYICPVCSVTFSSIEMYQSHMQGNKHQIKENFVVKLMKNTPKTYENFQDELADYIKVQKARGLEPNTTLRKTEECYERCKYDDKKDSSPPKGFTLQRRAPLENPRSFSRDCSWGSRSRSPYRSPSQRNFIRGRYTQTSQYHMKSYPKHQDIKETSFKVKVDGLSSVDSSKDLRHDSSDSSDSDHKERRQKRKHQKIKRHKGSQELKKDEHVEKKTKKSSEDTDSEKDNLNLEHKKEDLDTTNEEIVKHRKEKKSKADQSADKQGKKHKRDKKKKDIDPRTEEEKLWDESILGF